MRFPGPALLFSIAATVIFAAPLQAQFSNPAQLPNGKPGRFVEIYEHVVDNTNEWLRWYGALPSKRRGAMEPAAVNIARLRRAALKKLIGLSPELALERRLGQIDRLALPEKVIDQLETLVDTTGDYQAPFYWHSFDDQGNPAGAELQPGFLQLGDTQYVDPGLYGRRLGQGSKIALPVNGIAVDEAFAWLEEPFRFLDAAELEDLQLPPDAEALFSGGKVLLISGPNDFETIRNRLRTVEEIPGPLLPDVVDDVVRRAWTNGVKNILWVPVDFAAAPGSRFEESPTTDAIIDHADVWVRQSSRERSSIEVTYFPGTLRLPDTALAEALAEVRPPRPAFPASLVRATLAALADYDLLNGNSGQWLPNAYDRVAIVVSDALTQANGVTVARGAFSAAARNMVFYGLLDQFTLEHELGHTYLFGHSLYNLSSTSDPLGPPLRPDNIPWDFMGVSDSSAAPRHQPGVSAKVGAHWMERTEDCTETRDPHREVCDVVSEGTFRIVAHDNGPNDQLRALRIPTDDRIYWVGMRRQWPEKHYLHNGVQISYTTWYINRPNSFNGYEGPTYVGLRNTAYVPSEESPFQAGEIFEDAGRGVRITVEAVGSDGGVPYAEVTVERD